MLNKNLIKITIFVFCGLSAHNVFSQANAIDSLLLLTKNHKEDTTLVNLFIDIGKVYLNKSDWEKAKGWFDNGIELSRRINFRKGEANGYNQLGNVFLNLEKYAEAKNNFKVSLSIREDIHDKRGIGLALLGLSLAEWRDNHYDSAAVFCLQAMEYARQLNDSIMLVKILNTRANIYYRTGNFQKAAEWYFGQLKVAEAINDSINVAYALGNIGTVYTELHNIPEAIKFQKLALEKKLHNGQIRELSGTYSNLGRCYQWAEQFDSALYYYHLALAISVPNKLHKTTCVLYNNIADVFKSTDKLDSALFYNQLALEENKTIKDTLEIATNLFFKGEIYSRLASRNHRNDDYSKAVASYQESLVLFVKMNSENWIIRVYQKLSNIYSQQKTFGKAYYYLDKYTVLNDSIRDTTFTQQIAEMQALYETEKKQTKINLLNSEKEISTVMLAKRQTLNYSLAAIVFLILISSVFIYRNVQKKREAEKQVAVLEKQNAIESMRGKIASDVHDDMGAGLTKMGLFSQQLLQSATVTEKEKQLLEKISLQSKEVIDGMREIIWASNPANDNLKSMLGFMRQYIDRFFDGTDIRPVVNFPHQIGEVILHPEVRRNLFLILKESLNNAVKYSGSDKVDIDFSSEDANFNLNIKDYGKGMDDKNKDAFSNGMRNMQMRAEQIQSAFKMITSPGNGVQIFIEGKLY